MVVAEGIRQIRGGRVQWITPRTSDDPAISHCALGGGAGTVNVTRWAIGTQFLTESVLLSLIGGLTGAFLGVLGTVLYARSQDWGVVVPFTPIGLGLLAACLVGTIVGLYPAARAAAVPPTEALRSV